MEENLQKWGKPIMEALHGYTRHDLEPLFERYVLPFYYSACTFPKDFGYESKWKIINRETGEEYDRKEAFKRLKEEGYIK